jgi:enolase
MAWVMSLRAREILDSRGNPTVEVDVALDDGARGRAAVPSGASTGTREAIELRDADQSRYGGRGVTQAVRNINETLSPAFHMFDAITQEDVDRRLCELDGTKNKSHLGANAILGVSMAVAQASAASSNVPLYRYLGGFNAHLLPVPLLNVVNGGAHADNSLDFQEFMLVPLAAPSFREAMRMGTETYHALRGLLKKEGLSTAVGDEGGFAPNLKSHEQALDLLVAAIEHAGLRAGQDVALALDCAASELWSEDGGYLFRKSSGAKKSSEEMIRLFAGWLDNYPIYSIEDPLSEHDWEGWKAITRELGPRVQLVGDDVFVTDPATIRRAVAEQVGNAVLIKLNQIGTVTETLAAINEAQAGGYNAIVSHRSGETSDLFIADLAVATGAGQIKAGAPCRGERLAKYNQLMRIEDELGSRARYAGPKLQRRRADANKTAGA